MYIPEPYLFLQDFLVAEKSIGPCEIKILFQSLEGAKWEKSMSIVCFLTKSQRIYSMNRVDLISALNIQSRLVFPVNVIYW